MKTKQGALQWHQFIPEGSMLQHKEKDHNQNSVVSPSWADKIHSSEGPLWLESVPRKEQYRKSSRELQKGPLESLAEPWSYMCEKKLLKIWKPVGREGIIFRDCTGRGIVCLPQKTEQSPDTQTICRVLKTVTASVQGAKLAIDKRVLWSHLTLSSLKRIKWFLVT